MKVKLKTIIFFSVFLFKGQAFQGPPPGTPIQTNIPVVHSFMNMNYNIFTAPTSTVNCAMASGRSANIFTSFGLTPPVDPYGYLSGSSCEGLGDAYGFNTTDPSPHLSGETPVLGEVERDDVAGDILERVRNGTYTPPERTRGNPYNPQSYLTGLGTRTSFCPTGFTERDGEVVTLADMDYVVILSEDDRLRLTEELGPQPPWRPAGSGDSYVELPSTGHLPDDQEAQGYYRYNDSDGYVFGTDRTVYNIRAAGRILSEKNITMGVGDISSRNGTTKGHAEHQGGRDVDLRLIGPTRDGEARAEPCTVSDSSCYDRANTFEMIKAFIDVDPYGIDKVFINDSTLQGMVNEYMERAYSITGNIARSCSGHDNHVHLSFKNHSSPTPDEMMSRSR